jgi:hypothetical protein
MDSATLTDLLRKKGRTPDEAAKDPARHLEGAHR